MKNADLIRAISIDKNGPVEPHSQIRTGIEALIRKGDLKPGDRLPTIRQMAVIFGVSPATVMRPMRDLQREGVLTAKFGTGTFIAPPRSAATQVIIIRAPPQEGSAYFSFYAQIAEGLERGYGDPKRRFLTTYLQDKKTFTEQEIIASAQAMGVDGIVFFHNSPQMKDLVAHVVKVARVIPSVLLGSTEKTLPDQVVQDAAPACREWVMKRLEQGQRQFAYMGRRSIESLLPEHSPYAQAFRVFRSTLAAAGVTPVIALADTPLKPRTPEFIRYFSEMARLLSPQASVFTQLANMVEDVAGLLPAADIASYTECRETLDDLGHLASFLYLGMDRLAESAVPLLENRRRHPDFPSQIKSVSPVCVEKTAVRRKGAS